MPPEASPGRPIPTRHRRVSRHGQRSLLLSPLPGRSSPLFSAFQARCQGSAHSPWALRPARGEGAQPCGVGLARRSPADVCGTDESIMGERGGCACLGIRWDGSVLEARSRQREPGPEGEPRPDSSGSRRLPASPGLRPRRSGPCLCGHTASSSSAVQPPSCKDTHEDAGPTQTIRDPLPTPRSLPPFPRQSPSAVDGDSHGFWDQEGDVWGGGHRLSSRRPSGPGFLPPAHCANLPSSLPANVFHEEPGSKCCGPDGPCVVSAAYSLFK